MNKKKAKKTQIVPWEESLRQKFASYIHGYHPTLNLVSPYKVQMCCFHLYTYLCKLYFNATFN